MTAEKDNKVYTIDESTKDRYAAEGYDIRDDDGKVIAYGKGKTVPYEEYQRVLQELESLKDEKQKDEKQKDEKSAVKKPKEEDA